MTNHKTKAELDALDASARMEAEAKAAAAREKRSRAAQDGWRTRRADEYYGYGPCHCSPSNRFFRYYVHVR